MSNQQTNTPTPKSPLDFLNLPKPDLSKLPQFQRANELSDQVRARQPVPQEQIPQPKAEVPKPVVKEEVVPEVQEQPVFDVTDYLNLEDSNGTSETKATDESSKESISEESTDTSSSAKTEPAESTDQSSDEPGETFTKDDNFKRLRTKVKAQEDALKAKDTELQSVAEKLKKYETGEIVPDVLQELQNENAKLSRYEKLHNLKASPEYFNTYVKPLDELTGSLKTLAKEYDLPEEVLDAALNTTSKAELNRFLSDHFDTVGAIEAQGIVTKIKSLKESAVKAEQEPAKELARLQQEQQAIRQEQNARRRKSISEATRSAWSQSYDEICQEGIAVE